MNSVLNRGELECLMDRQNRYDKWMAENGADLLHPTSSAMLALHLKCVRWLDEQERSATSNEGS